MKLVPMEVKCSFLAKRHLHGGTKGIGIEHDRIPNWCCGRPMGKPASSSTENSMRAAEVCFAFTKGTARWALLCKRIPAVKARSRPGHPDHGRGRPSGVIDINATYPKADPGTLVSIDSQNPGQLVVSAQAYDRTVAGIVSGAGGVKPGMMMGQQGSMADGKHPVALSGRSIAKPMLERGNSSRRSVNDFKYRGPCDESGRL